MLMEPSGEEIKVSFPFKSVKVKCAFEKSFTRLSLFFKTKVFSFSISFENSPKCGVSMVTEERFFNLCFKFFKRVSASASKIKGSFCVKRKSMIFSVSLFMPIPGPAATTEICFIFDKTFINEVESIIEFLVATFSTIISRAFEATSSYMLSGTRSVTSPAPALRAAFAVKRAAPVFPWLPATITA